MDYIEGIIKKLIMKNYAQAEMPDGTFDLEKCDKPALKKIASELIRLLMRACIYTRAISRA